MTPTWERSVFVEPDQVERRGFTFCVLEQLRSALRRRDVFVSKSTQWGGPRAQLLGLDSWGKARTSTCRMLGLSSTPEPFLENIGRELDEAYRRTADRWRQNAAVRIEAAGEREELVLTGLDGLEDPPSLVELRALTERDAAAGRPAGAAARGERMDRICRRLHPRERDSFADPRPTDQRVRRVDR